MQAFFILYNSHLRGFSQECRVLRQWSASGRAVRAGMNPSQPYAVTISANGTRAQVLATLATRHRVPP